MTESPQQGGESPTFDEANVEQERRSTPTEEAAHIEDTAERASSARLAEEIESERLAGGDLTDQEAIDAGNAFFAQQVRNGEISKEEYKLYTGKKFQG